MKTPNLTIIFIALAAIVLVGLAGGVVLTIADKDATPFYGFFTATLATVVAFAGIIRSQSAIAEKVTQVETKVNGNLTRLIDIASNKVTVAQADVDDIVSSTGVLPTVVRDGD